MPFFMLLHVAFLRNSLLFTCNFSCWFVIHYAFFSTILTIPSSCQINKKHYSEWTRSVHRKKNWRERVRKRTRERDQKWAEYTFMWCGQHSKHIFSCFNSLLCTFSLRSQAHALIKKNNNSNTLQWRKIEWEMVVGIFALLLFVFECVWCVCKFAVGTFNLEIGNWL